MKSRRKSAAMGLIKGIIAAVGVTLIGMVVLAGLVIFTGMGDSLIRVLNQALKALAVIAGTYLAVGRGGERGLVTGAGVGAAYAVIGYVTYMLTGGGEFSIVELMGEILIAVAAGAASGAVFANMKPRKKRGAK